MVQQVDAAFVQKKIEEGVPVLNVLSTGQYDAKHIRGSLNAPVERPGFDEAVQRFAPDKMKPLVVHCSNMACQASSKAARKMEAMGYLEVYEYKAGIEDWESKQLPMDGLDLAGTGRTSQARATERPPDGPVRPERKRERDRTRGSEMPPI